MVEKAHCYARDFRGVRIELHHSQARFRQTVETIAEGAAVSVSKPGDGWGARIYSVGIEGSMRLGFFWDEGYRSIKACLEQAGVNTNWIEATT